MHLIVPPSTPYSWDRSQDCGILQWINHLLPYKAACEEIYTAEGIYKRRCADPRGGNLGP